MPDGLLDILRGEADAKPVAQTACIRDASRHIPRTEILPCPFRLIHRLLNAQSDLAVGINGNVNFPNGKFTEYFGTGYGGDAHFLYLFGNSSIFSLSVGYNRFGLDTDAFNAKANELGLNVKFDVESSFSTIPILLGVKWYFLKQKTQSPYIMIEAGFYNYNFTLNGTAEIDTNGNVETVNLSEIDEKGTETMLRISAGYIIFIQKHWFIDASLNYIATGKKK